MLFFCPVWYPFAQYTVVSTNERIQPAPGVHGHHILALLWSSINMRKKRTWIDRCVLRTYVSYSHSYSYHRRMGLPLSVELTRGLSSNTSTRTVETSHSEIEYPREGEDTSTIVRFLRQKSYDDGQWRDTVCAIARLPDKQKRDCSHRRGLSVRTGGRVGGRSLCTQR